MDMPPGKPAHGHPQPDAPQRQAQARTQGARRHLWPSPDEGGGPENDDPQAQETQLG